MQSIFRVASFRVLLSPPDPCLHQERPARPDQRRRPRLRQLLRAGGIHSRALYPRCRRGLSRASGVPGQRRRAGEYPFHHCSRADALFSMDQWPGIDRHWPGTAGDAICQVHSYRIRRNKRSPIYNRCCPKPDSSDLHFCNNSGWSCRPSSAASRAGTSRSRSAAREAGFPAGLS